MYNVKIYYNNRIINKLPIIGYYNYNIIQIIQ